MDEDALVTGSMRSALARRFAAFGIGAALAVCVVAYVVTWQWSRSVGHDLTNALAGLEDESAELKASVMLSRQLDEFMRERISDVQGWASSPTIVSAARQAHSVHEKSGLLARSVEELEEKFQIRKSLGRFPIADSYLRAELARSRHFDRVLFTDRNGYNVVVTNVSSDFVQSDEGWWQRAWNDGLALSTVQYDDSMGAWAIDISVRIDDPATENPVGVMQAALSIALLQDITNQYIEQNAGQRITVVDSQGLLLAETSSGHSGARIMNEKVNVRDEDADARQVVFGSERWGQVVDGAWVTGYSRTAGGDFYADLTGGFRFPGFNWGVTVQSEGSGALVGPEIETVAVTVGAWRKVLAAVLGGSLVVVILLALGTGWWMARRMMRPIDYLREVTQKMSQGKATGAVRLDTNDELSEIASALDRIRRTMHLAVRILRERKRNAAS